MIILDTNVVSAVMQPDLNPIVIDWLNAQRSVDIWLTSVTLHEIRYGIEIMPAGPKRSGLEGRLGLILTSALGARIHNLDADAVRYSAVVQAKAK